MILGKKHFLARAIQGPPLLDPPLETAQLTIAEVSRILALQMVENGLGFQAPIHFQQRCDLTPYVSKRILPRTPGTLAV